MVSNFISYAIRGFVAAKEPRYASSGSGQGNYHCKGAAKIEPGRLADILELAPGDEDLLEVELFMENESSEIFVEAHISGNGY